MKDNNKYYTPTIDEFYVGFEFEYLEKSIKEWIKVDISNWSSPKNEQEKDLLRKINYWDIYTKQSCDSCDNNTIRVKYLDKEDIESLGWVLNTNSKSSFWIEYWLGRYQLTMGVYENNKNPYKIRIDNGLYYEENETYFEGVIKNISELKKLMKQLGINEQKN